MPPPPHVCVFIIEDLNEKILYTLQKVKITCRKDTGSLKWTGIVTLVKSLPSTDFMKLENKTIPK